MVNIVKKELLNIIYHDLDKVKSITETSFKIKFPDIAEASKLVKMRHDIVHRNGKNKKGEEIIVDKKKVTEAIDTIEASVSEVNHNSMNEFQ